MYEDGLDATNVPAGRVTRSRTKSSLPSRKVILKEDMKEEDDSLLESKESSDGGSDDKYEIKPSKSQQQLKASSSAIQILSDVEDSDSGSDAASGGEDIESSDSDSSSLSESELFKSKPKKDEVNKTKRGRRGRSVGIHPVYGCAICKSGFQSVDHLQQHFKTVNKNGSHPKEPEDETPHYYCHACKTELFCTIEALEEHAMEKHVCKHCPSILKGPRALYVHDYIYHQQITLAKCDYCEKTCQRGEELLKHALNDHQNEYGIEPLACKICNQKFPSGRQYLWKKHMDESHGQEILGTKCTVGNCIHVSYHPSVLILHPKLSHEKRFVCQECGRGYVNEARLTRHKQARHDPKSEKPRTTVICELCGLECKGAAAYGRHKRCSHMEDVEVDKIFQCDLCGLRFGRKHGLSTHITVKHNGAPESEGSDRRKGKKKVQRQKIQRPKKIRRKWKDREDLGNHHQCHICGHKYSTKCLLWSHLKIQHLYIPQPGEPAQPVPQEVAEAAEAEKNYLRFVCHFEGCSAKYIRNISLRRHWKTFHNFVPARSWSHDQE